MTTYLYFASNRVPDEKLAGQKNFDLFRKLGMLFQMVALLTLVSQGG